LNLSSSFWMPPFAASPAAALPILASRSVSGAVAVPVTLNAIVAKPSPRSLNAARIYFAGTRSSSAFASARVIS
jgi:hypothetical protein